MMHRSCKKSFEVSGPNRTNAMIMPKKKKKIDQHGKAKKLSAIFVQKSTNLSPPNNNKKNFNKLRACFPSTSGKGFRRLVQM